ncbi:MAG: hypothetical protein R3A48_04005 [Polyangiales bacterium]
MIPVAPAEEPPTFNAHVRERGKAAIGRLLGQSVLGPGRKPVTTYARPEDIPGNKFPTYWTETRGGDGKSALDDLMDSYAQTCAYLGMRLERATGSPTVDHFVPKERDWQLVYEWSNYRLSAGCVNGAKGTRDVVDPFKVQSGWFELDLDTFRVHRGQSAPATEHGRIDRTLEILNLRQCVSQRGDFIQLYRNEKIMIREVERYAPFIAAELRRQGRLMRGDT